MYCVLTVVPLLVCLFMGYPLHISRLCKLNPYIFIKKIFKVIVYIMVLALIAYSLILYNKQ